MKKNKDETIKRPVGKPLAFESPQELEEAINDYFDTISVMKVVTDTVVKGYDEINGELVPVTEEVPVLNSKDEPVYYRHFILPPSILGMCEHLGIHRASLLNYEKKGEEYFNTIKKAKEIVEKYLEQKLQREQGQVTGIIFNLKNNFGWKDKQEVEHSGEMKIPDIIVKRSEK